jgi:3-methylcrotonyl-CoA carboxylase alpha subunit
MEMNTRLQVEHPVTEEAVRVAGEPLDLVKLQLLVAMGHRLPFQQSDITTVGHAIEARVYAESPKDGFLPGSGHLAFVEEPQSKGDADHKVRVDTGFRSGDDVLIYYDPMIAKVIAWGKDRSSALDVLQNALKQYHIVGIPTNIDFLQRSLENNQFRAGGVTTKFIEENKETLLAPSRPSDVNFALAVAALMSSDTSNLFSSFRLNQSLRRSLTLVDSDKVAHKLDCTVSNGEFEVTGPGPFTHVVQLIPVKSVGTSYIAFIGNGARTTFRVVINGSTIALLTQEGTVTFHVTEESMEGKDDEASAKQKGGVIRSPINGKVVKLCFPPGSVVLKGQTLLILEAMKMEHNVKAPCDGTVTYSCKEKAMVAADSALANIVANQ